MFSFEMQIVIIAAPLVVALGLGQPAQSSGQAKVTIRNNEVFLEDPSGTIRQLTRDGQYKEHAALSPSAEKVAYHGKYDAYATPRQQPVVTILNVESGVTVHTIMLEWNSRHVDEVWWVSDRLVAVDGEELVILDADQGLQLHRLPGGVISPDGKKIVFREPRAARYGPIPQQLQSSTIALSLVDKPYDKPIPSEAVIDRAPFSPSVRIYPTTSSWDERKRELWFPDLTQRHSLCSDLVWAPDSQRIGFVEYHQGTFWAVLLALSVDSDQVRVQHHKVDLGPAFAGINSDGLCRGGARVTWVAGGQLRAWGKQGAVRRPWTGSATELQRQSARTIGGSASVQRGSSRFLRVRVLRRPAHQASRFQI